ncbi:N-acetylglucosamine-6-phosphate deacetylase [Thermaerobacter sp. PB12/4term]|uniref:N-acetylglucosamine-6-phosphate deacetylase n=1 Tax=Thermaerobacter sp. PB12/4term TaxID=2293838 RepID=UPI000E329668|nr:N-acetylglucosamine-6-phosphate deacetylase [Thermaerobacter sp. PB12/4term]QIA26587.1 N-acetylglucosamine-6-phosphate deacetylase [Thermaerobacter sp. PB12/4term]
MASMDMTHPLREAAEGFTLRSRRIVVPGGILDGYVRVAGGRIVEVGAGEPPAAAGGMVTRLGDAWLLPGMIDLHIHGLGGWDTYDLRPEAARHLGLLLAATGTTAYWPTLATAEWDAMEAACAFWGGFVREEWAGGGDGRGAGGAPGGASGAGGAGRAGGAGLAGSTGRTGGASGAGDPAGSAGPAGPAGHPAWGAGARPLGLHLEGPFLNPRKPGAMRPEWMVPPDAGRLQLLLDRARGTVRRVTLAPELPRALDLVRHLRRLGVVVAAGHSEASYGEAVAAFHAGVTLGNHIFNAMPPLHHREPGLLGAVMDLPFDGELIADGVHVHPAAMRLLWRLKGTSRLAVISDAVAAALLPPGRYDLRAFVAEVRPDGTSRLADGTLAGSTATMLTCLRVLVEQVGVPWPEAARMTAAVPARIAGVGERKGAIVPGLDADLFALDEQWRVVATWVEGVPVHTPERPLVVADLINRALAVQ